MSFALSFWTAVYIRIKKTFGSLLAISVIIRIVDYTIRKLVNKNNTNKRISSEDTAQTIETAQTVGTTTEDTNGIETRAEETIVKTEELHDKRNQLLIIQQQLLSLQSQLDQLKKQL